MTNEIKKFDHLFSLPGLNENLIKNHLSLYEGYVNNLKKLLDERRVFLNNQTVYVPAFFELSRRLAWEWNGVRLHELYFENFCHGKEKITNESELNQKIIKNFGSWEKWQNEFKYLGTARGIGWVILAYDKTEDKLFNLWINEHDTGHLAGATPIVVLDVFEHAFMIDLNLKRVDYVQIFLENIDWKIVEKRLF